MNMRKNWATHSNAAGLLAKKIVLNPAILILINNEIGRFSSTPRAFIKILTLTYNKAKTLVKAKINTHTSVSIKEVSRKLFEENTKRGTATFEKRIKEAAHPDDLKRLKKDFELWKKSRDIRYKQKWKK